MLVYASGKDASEPDQPLHASFKLNATKGGVYLMASSGQLLDKIEYENQPENVSLGRNISDRNTLETFDKPTPGFSNDDAGYVAFSESRKLTGSPLMITEVMSSNKTTLVDNTGAYSDYIEIYNSGSEGDQPQGIWLIGRSVRCAEVEAPRRFDRAGRIFGRFRLRGGHDQYRS